VSTSNIAVHAFPQTGGAFRVVLTVTKAGLTTTSTISPTTFRVQPPPEASQWLVPGLAYTDGLAGAFWQSDVTIFNPHATGPMTVSLAFLDATSSVTDPAALPWNTIVIPARSALAFPNVLRNPPFFQPKGKFGALLVRGDVTPALPVITSRTYNSGTGQGTYGLSIAPPRRAASGRSPAPPAASLWVSARTPATTRTSASRTSRATM
jgi:hypothetical protein